MEPWEIVALVIGSMAVGMFLDVLAHEVWDRRQERKNRW